MRLLVVSDVHCEEGPNNVKRYKDIIERVKPDVVLGLGDWGECSTYDFMDGQKIVTIYGNHDNVNELKRKTLLLDGTAVNIGGLMIGGVSGIVSLKGTPTKSGTPRKKPEEFIEKARSLRGVDVLLLHEAPYMPEVFGRMWRSVGPLTALSATELIKPKVLVVGHLHLAPALHALYKGIHVFHVDTSKGGHLVVDTSELSVEGRMYSIKMFKVSLDSIITRDAII